MNGTCPPRAERVANAILFAAIGFAVALFAADCWTRGAPDILAGSPAHAQAGSMCASPGYLFFDTKVGEKAKFYICDTTQQVICVYEANNDKLRLVSARKYDADLRILDGAAKNGPVAPLEVHNGGVDRKTAKVIGDAQEAAGRAQ